MTVTAEQLIATTETQQGILIVDDEEGMRETLADILEDKGFVVGMASDGREAVDRMGQEHYDVVLIDIMMPGMNGVETLQEIRAINPRITTVVMTGHSQLEGLVSEALLKGVDGVLYKPFEVDAVIEMIERKSQQLVSLPVIDLTRYQIDPRAVRLVPEEMARKYSLMPLRVDDGHLIVAMTNPTDLRAIEDLRIRTSLNVKPIRASRLDVERTLPIHYQNGGEISRQADEIRAARVEEKRPPVVLQASADIIAQAPAVRVVEQTIRQAVRDRASDIHLEPEEDHLRIRYRIDGVLHDAMRMPLEAHSALISRIKVLADLNIVERRRPQGGQFSIDIDKRTIDIRVATISTIHGEMAVLRVLDKAVSVRSFEELGFLPDMGKIYERIIRSPAGIILIAGPTGSGKTTTLYASVSQLDKVENKIITIEDPVEYQFEKISQVQVNRQAGITFASGLRAAMRLDPDIILVGEIRDQETASTAVQASLTGHLVLSSIHANDAVGAVLRLIDLGIEPFLVTSSLLSVISQRLARRVCPRCGAARQIGLSEREAYEKEMGEKRARFQMGAGCTHCAKTGYRDRVAIYELLVVNEEFRRLVLKNASVTELRGAALDSGMRTMFRDGMMKVKAGVTTPAEVMRKVFALN